MFLKIYVAPMDETKYSEMFIVGFVFFFLTIRKNRIILASSFTGDKPASAWLHGITSKHYVELLSGKNQVT